MTPSLSNNTGAQAPVSDATVSGYVGQSQAPVGGDRFLTGRGRFIDDISLPGMTHMAVLRSPYAHAHIHHVDLDAVRASPMCLSALEGKEAARIAAPMPHRGNPSIVGGNTCDIRCLAFEKAVYAGEPVAAVVAASRNDAEALLELISVDYEQLPHVLDGDEALTEDAPTIHEEWGSNLVCHVTHVEGDVDGGLASAPNTLADEFRIHRYSTQPIETRGYVGDWDTRTETVTLHGSAQNPHPERFAIAESMGITEERVRVILPDIGGAFGLKMHPHPEEVLVCVLSRELGRPVKWIESRAECLLIGGREQVHRWEVAFENSGRILALRDHFVANIGALSATPGWGMARLTALTFPGGYKVPAMDVQVSVAVTNKGPWNASRGYGKEATALVLEHICDRIAQQLELDPTEVRRQNFVEAHEFPYKTNSGLNLDSGDYDGLLDKAIELSNYKTLREGQARARAAGKTMGIGVAFELTPEGADLPGSFTGGFDTSTVRMSPTGRVTVLGGTTTPGSGNDTAIAQIVADELGVELTAVRVIQGDTEICPYGFGNGNGRSTMMGGGSAQLAARDVRERIVTIAARLLDTLPENISLARGQVTARDSSRSMSVAEVAYTAYTLAYREALGVDSSLEATRVYKPGNIDHRPDEKGRIQPYATFSNAVHICAIELDTETGRVTILSHSIADDCGNMINPAAVKGQMVGAAVMGIGGALSEHLRYDSAGRLISDGFKAYLMPRARDLPTFDFDHQITPSPFTSLGTKGAGEAGVGGAAAALTNAVNDALSEIGVVVRELPLSAPNLLRIITQSHESSEGGAHGG